MQFINLLFISGLLLFASCAKEKKFAEASVNTGFLASYERRDGAHGIEETKKRYVKEMTSNSNSVEVLDSKKLAALIVEFNSNENIKGEPIDAFISKLPKNYRRHFTLVHRSYSIQKASPMSPRVILFGQDAKVMMTFNAGLNDKGEAVDGGNTIEVIEWNQESRSWDFLELTFNKDKKIAVEFNPAKCVMCHSGTPKAIDITEAHHYKKLMKPIFPQYPFWPGFYGSVNDIVGIDSKDSRDTIMRNLNSTIDQIKTLTFSETEELFRLRKLLDTNPKYLDVIENELDVHKKYFHRFIDSIKTRNRYKHLVTLKDLYTDKGQAVPEHLKSAPFRRTFEVDYGHYLFRPNFHLSTLMTFYQSQFVTKEIESFPLYHKMKYSLLARKYNCGGVNLEELDSSFDLVYPNIVDEKTREKQYLLAYQYNIVGSHKKDMPHLPLHAWNLESNEEIASYHYGNVFADLNELVLWRLATNAIPSIKHIQGRPAAEARHYTLPHSTLLKDILEKGAGGFVSKMGQKQMDFANNFQQYYETESNLKAQPVSNLCQTHFVPRAIKELAELKDKDYPSLKYPLDQRLLDLEQLAGGLIVGTSVVRQACENCHTEKIKPKFNTDWYSDTYAQDIHLDIRGKKLGDLMQEVLSTDTLPVPYGNQMPFGRKRMDEFSLECEKLIITNSMKSSISLKGKVFQCREGDVDSLNCRCEKMYKIRSKLKDEFY